MSPRKYQLHVLDSARHIQLVRPFGT